MQAVRARLPWILAVLLLLAPSARAQQGEAGDQAPSQEGSGETQEGGGQDEAGAPAGELAPVEGAGADRRERAQQAEADVARELATIEQQVNQLKEDVFRTKAKLMLLEEKVIKGLVSGSRLVLKHSNGMGPSFDVESVEYVLDGAVIFRSDEGLQRGGKEGVELFQGSLPPGNHLLVVKATLRGDGAGVFGYLEDYRFTLRASHAFATEDAMTSHLDIRFFEKGGLVNAFTERPDVGFELRSERTELGARPGAGDQGP